MTRRDRIRTPPGPPSWTRRITYVGGPLDGQLAPPHASPRHAVDGGTYVLQPDRRFTYQEDIHMSEDPITDPDPDTEQPPVVEVDEDPRTLAEQIPRNGSPHAERLDADLPPRRL